MKSFVVNKISPDLHFEALTEGLALRFAGKGTPPLLYERHEWRGIHGLTSLGTYLMHNHQALIERGVMEVRDESLFFSNEQLGGLEEEEEDSLLLEQIAPWSRFSLSVRASGFIGDPDFRFSGVLYLGLQQTYAPRVGMFLQWQNQAYRIPFRTHQILEQIREFNALEPQERSREKALRIVANLHETAKVGSIELDEFLKTDKVVVPSKVKVDVEVDSGGRISLVPLFEGVESTLLRNSFFENGVVPDVYNLAPSAGERIRVLIPPELREVLGHMQKVRHVGGTNKERILMDINSCFPDGIDRGLIDFSGFGPRVSGIGGLPRRARLSISSGELNWRGVDDALQDADAAADIEPTYLLQLENHGEVTELSITRDDVRVLAEKAQTAQVMGQPSIKFNDQTIVLDDAFHESLAKLVSEVESAKSDDKPEPPSHNYSEQKDKYQYLQVYSNEEAPDYKEGAYISGASSFVPDELLRPSSLLTTRRDGTSIDLKHHQLEGIRWLRLLFENRESRPGGLLADDMGLGKTLQILSFLAWCAEGGYSALANPAGPWEPVLIVAPLILLNNWEKEIQAFFDDSVFQPRVLLHGAQLKQLTTNRIQGKELELGVAKLDIERLKQNRVVITNYDTLRNYQHSLGRVRWSVIVTDESQEFKDQNAKSEVMKALNGAFRIACTGTPVENRLLDLWNIVDFIHPIGPFGTAKEFSKEFERDIASLSDEERRALSAELRTRLLYGEPDALLLRREKSEVLELPQKRVHRIEFPLSKIERDLHLNLVTTIQQTSDKGAMLKLLQRLKQLYLHPAILTGKIDLDAPQQLLTSAPRLLKVREILDEVRRRGEKVLIFTDSIKMQSILARVFGELYGLEIDTINGGQDGGNRHSANRLQIIERFETKNGFNVLILSPRVAGVGLTITAANHVIHYSRWWNPAKESQATDRVYRIGQKREVHVYYPIATDSTVQTFDQTLEQLLTFKSTLAADFLIPSALASCSEEELLHKLRSMKPSPGSDSASNAAVVVPANLDPGQFEVLIALLWQKQGYKTIVTPLSGDQGIDVVAIGKSDVHLIQVKHWAAPVDINALDELDRGFEYYRSCILGGLFRSHTPHTVLVCSGKIARETARDARRRDIQTTDGAKLKSLVSRHKPTLAEVEALAMQRCSTLDEVGDRATKVSS
jgi:superfamily II DNA or RNA helicase